MSFKLSDVPAVAGQVTLTLNDRQKLADGETLMIPLDDGQYPGGVDVRQLAV